MEIGLETVDGVCEAIQSLMSKPVSELNHLSQQSRQAAELRYGQELYVTSLRQALCKLVSRPRPDIWNREDSGLRVPLGIKIHDSPR